MHSPGLSTKDFIVPRASHKTVTGNACRGKKLPVIRQVNLYQLTIISATSGRTRLTDLFAFMYFDKIRQIKTTVLYP